MTKRQLLKTKEIKNTLMVGWSAYLSGLNFVYPVVVIFSNFSRFSVSICLTRKLLDLKLTPKTLKHECDYYVFLISLSCLSLFSSILMLAFLTIQNRNIKLKEKAERELSSERVVESRYLILIYIDH